MGKSSNRDQRRSLPDLNVNTPTKKAYKAALEGSNTVIATGVPGSGKTYMAAVTACEGLLDKRFEKLVISRPAKGTEEDLGFEPGNMDDKMAGWTRPVTESIIHCLGKSQYEARLGKTIELVPLHQLMGRSFFNSFILVDEGQSMSIETAKSLVTRTGRYSKLVICGDIKQKSIKPGLGLIFLLDLVNRYNMPVNLIEFGLDDCIRSKECRMWLNVFDEEGLL